MKKPRTNFKNAQKAYTEDSLKKALDDVNNKKFNKYQASIRYNIPYSTLNDRLNEKNKKPSVGKGASPWISKEFETLLVEVIQKLSDWGHGLSFSIVRDFVKHYLVSNKIPNRFNDNTPGRDWYYHFINRWKDQLRTRRANNLSSARAASCTKEVIDNFFEMLKQNNIDKIDPKNRWNVDETGFSCDPKKTKIICRKTTKNPLVLIGNNEKFSYTLEFCCNSVGEYLPPFVLYKSKHLYDTWCIGGPKNTVYSTSPSGWMEAQQFIQWFKSVFLVHTAKNPGEKVLFFDGHFSHVSIELIKLAMDNNVKLICLPPHSSHILQPLDVGVYGHVKKEWRKILKDHYGVTSQQNVDKIFFPKLLNKLFAVGFRASDAILGFCKTGLYPLNKNVISKKDTAIGETFAETISIENENLNETKNSKKINQQAQLVEDAKQSLMESVLQHLQKSNKETTSSKKTIIKRKFGEVLTENDVIKKLEDEEANRLNKKMKKTSSKSKGPKADSIECETPLISPLNDLKICFKCQTKFGAAKKKQNKWISCEKCNNWSCGKCLPKDFDPKSEFFCSKKCAK